MVIENDDSTHTHYTFSNIAFEKFKSFVFGASINIVKQLKENFFHLQLQLACVVRKFHL